MERFDYAQICPNGHVANEYRFEFPQFNKEYCERCGEKTLANCSSCQEAIRGAYLDFGGAYRKPAFCQHCGVAFPWTERQLKAARELAELEEALSTDEKEQLERDLEQVVKDSPEAQVAASRISILLKKFASGTAGAVRDIAVNVASEAAKKILLGP